MFPKRLLVLQTSTPRNEEEEEDRSVSAFDEWFRKQAQILTPGQDQQLQASFSIETEPMADIKKKKKQVAFRKRDDIDFEEEVEIKQTEHRKTAEDAEEEVRGLVWRWS